MCGGFVLYELVCFVNLCIVCVDIYVVVVMCV